MNSVNKEYTFLIFFKFQSDEYLSDISDRTMPYRVNLFCACDLMDLYLGFGFTFSVTA